MWDNKKLIKEVGRMILTGFEEQYVELVSMKFLKNPNGKEGQWI